MKKLFSTLFLALFVLTGSLCAQERHAHWKSQVRQLEADRYEVTVTAILDSAWHVYDTLRTLTGPPATIVDFQVLEAGRKPAAEKVGPMQVLGQVHKYYDDIFMMEVGYFEDSVVFKQEFQLLKDEAQVRVYMEWMTCDENNCSPLTDDEFIVNIPEKEEAQVKAANVKSTGNLLAMILEAIVWGLVALLTPCIFPMVPMTVSFFMKGSEDKRTGRLRAALYGIFIVLLYTLPIAALILITRIFGGDAVTADIFNWLATNWLPNIIFFIVFMVFAASFFGLFEITMPGSLTTKTDSRADSKGVGGIFFMALTLVLVSFSCTGPIVGTVVIKSISGEFWTPILTMFFFSVAFALPFTLLALFPSWLNHLPKSGGWLGCVKIILGFVEVALAFKFLSMADQAYHWNILPRDLYLAIWIVLATLLFFYMIGLLKFRHAPWAKWGPGRIGFTLVILVFDICLICGILGKPLSWLSGYLPPMQEKGWFYDNSVHYEMEDYDITKVKYADKLHLPHGLNGFFDLNQAKSYAQKVNKPLFIDFSGHACVNCREMEMRVWSDPRVLEILRNDYVVVALYCDDKMKVDESEWITVGDKTLTTMGKINSYIAFSKYGVNAQPCYILEGLNGELLADPRGYDTDIEAFIKFLEQGKANFVN